MGSRDHAEQLRALADAHDVLAQYEDAAADAKTAYREALDSGDQAVIEAAKATHREASTALNDAREATTGGGVMVADNTPGSSTVSPSTVRAGG